MAQFRCSEPVKSEIGPLGASQKDYQVGAGSTPAVAVAVVGNNGHLIHTMGGVRIDGACISLLYRG